MSRFGIIVALLGLTFGGMGTAVAPAAPAPIEQAKWSSLKKPILLLNGLKLSYVELGNPKGEPLLLLHGFTDTSRTWSLIAPYIADFRLIIPDQRGHGSADAPPCCYSTQVYADDARQLMDVLDIKKAAVLGHSMGSMVAMTMAAEFPDRVSKIVLIGSTALPAVKRGGWLYENATALKAPIDRNSDFMREWHPANQPTSVDPKFAEAAMEEVLQVPIHVWRGVMRELVEVPVGRHAVDVKVPVLILSGGKDPLFPAEHHASLVAAFPGSEAHVYPDLGHNPLWERPEELGPTIDAFLKRPASN
jgi:pimeloyl-ACP methyl ester carboxylesterase